MTTKDPTRRRLQALACIGHTPERIAHGTGVPAWAIWVATTNDRYTLTARHQTAVHTYYATHQDHPITGGEADQTRTDARTARWAAPAAWDNIDNPDEHPTGNLPCVAPDCQRDGRYAGGYCGTHRWRDQHGKPIDTPVHPTVRPDPADVARLTNQGWTATRIAEHLGVTTRTVARHRTKETAA